MRTARRLALLIAATAPLVFAAPDLDARPGGGQSFGGSRSSGSSSGSRSSGSSWGGSSGSRSSGSSWGSGSSSGRSGGGSFSWPRSSSPSSSSPSSGSSGWSGSGGSHGDFPVSGFFFLLLVDVGVVAVGGVLLNRAFEGFRQDDWETGLPDRSDERRERHAFTYRSLIDAIDTIRIVDPDFSFVLFEDFLYALYAEAHTARGSGRIRYLEPYFTDDARAALGALGEAEVSAIVIGALRIEGVEIANPVDPIRVVAVFEANYTERKEGRDQAYYTTERWTLRRLPGVKSRPPEEARVIGCPNCGAPLDKMVGRKCGYCDKVIEPGEQDWEVERVEVLELRMRGPMLTGTTEEVGTLDPTIVAPDVQGRWRELTAKDPALDWAKLTARIELIFTQFQAAWTRREPALARPYLSDNLFQTQLYWIDAYKREGLRNLTDGAHIVSIQLARVVSDAHYDAITVRVFASGLDYTVNEQGELVGGSKSKPRDYSEYWTLIRGVDRAGAPSVAPVCPNCGAGLDITMAGNCAFCGVKVTAGQFDWVLSRIEQDEVYG